jgi:hypothetical protein
MDKHSIILYDSNKKFCDKWDIEPSILAEFPDYYKTMVEKLGQYPDVKRLLEAFMTDFQIVSNVIEASNTFKENGHSTHIKVR